ncbi:sugar phosphate isomerase/epimerase family protein [Foetidibacter luteolus]|uniref:sugar phosphate isomerase/epimerase family protein n=1 Tax=Foetidibacter luteolus TaxID=2608880 RepID=UPI00129A5ED9|nr:sugar phosphate isomerase/epimerase [Foetidibacter luteolus]
MSIYSRRAFLQSAGMLAAGTLLSKNLLASPAPLKEFGLQLYTLRDDLPKDPKGILKQVASFGYKQLESFEGAQGMFWGMSPADFKSYVGDLGMTMVSSHCDINKDFEKKAADAASIGMKYLICPWIGPQKTLDDFKRYADTFNERGEICKKNGIRFAYHNHGYSFKELEGKIPQDVMMDATNPDTVDYEMDMYWVVNGGADINAYLKKYGKRFRLCHVKDRIKGSTEADASCILGQGDIDYASILKLAQKSGVQYFIVEQERYDGSTPIESAKADAAYLKTLSV